MFLVKLIDWNKIISIMVLFNSCLRSLNKEVYKKNKLPNKKICKKWIVYVRVHKVENRMFVSAELI